MRYMTKHFRFFSSTLFFFFCLSLPLHSKAQALRIAILDFQNISGITKYDGLGKAMSSMLITDIESNVSPKRLQLVERSQIQKIIKEQNFQASGSVNKSTAVQAGKILGVKFLLIGDVFILNDQLVINARLTNTETGDIVFSKRQEGKMINWLTLKTNIAKDLATNLAMPFTEPRINDVTITTAVLTTFANAIDEKDKGNFEKAETLISAAKEFDPAFGYLDDLKDDVDKLKKQVAEQGKKIEVLEKSGGRIVDAKTYEELKLNLTNQLTSYEERKKIFVQMINTYPDQWDKNRSVLFYEIFQKQYNFYQLGLDGCNLFLNEMLKSRDFIKKESLQSFDNSVYNFLGQSLLGASKRVFFKHDFSNEDYFEFKKTADVILKNAFNTQTEQLFAQLAIMSCFNYDIKQMNQEVKKDILSIHKAVYASLNFPFGEEIIKQLENVASEDDAKNPFNESKSVASEKMIIFLSAKRNDYKTVINLFEPYNFRITDEKAFKYYYENNEGKKTSNDRFLGEMKDLFNYFFIPSFDTQDPYFTDYRGNKTLNEFPEIIPLDENAKKAIIQLDSSTRRYTRIMENLRNENIDEDPCRVSALSSWLIKQSDSTALVSNYYVLNNKLEIGSKVDLIYNYGKDTLFAYVVGKKITNTSKEFEIIDNKILKSFNKNQIVKYIRRGQGNGYQDIRTNNREESDKVQFENNNAACEAKKGQEAKQQQFAFMMKKQAEEQRQKKDQEKLAYKNKINTVIGLFSKKPISADTVAFHQLTKQVEEEDIELDSLFNLAFHLLVGDIKNPQNNGNFDDKSDAQLSILLNLYFIDQIGERNINPVTFNNFKNAAIINLAHGYLLSSIKFGVNALELAFSEYNNVPSNFKFDQGFNSFSRDGMITADWNDFISKGLITKSNLDAFNSKYKIIKIWN